MAEKSIPSMELRCLLAEIEELMGRRSLILLLRQSGLAEYVDRRLPRDDTPSIAVAQYSLLLANSYFTFGAREARHIFRRTGRLVAAELHHRPLQFAMTGAALRLLPAVKSMPYVLQKLADQGAETYGATCYLYEEADAFFFEIVDCPYCAEIKRQSQARKQPVTKPVCHIPSAILEETMEWVTAEKHLVEEVDCVATGGAACRFRISK